MNVRSGIALGLGFAILTCGSPALADTTFVAECVCPLCKTEFKAVLAGSGTMFNRRLDLRPVGAIRSPWPQGQRTLGKLGKLGRFSLVWLSVYYSLCSLFCRSPRRLNDGGGSADRSGRDHTAL